MPIEVKKTKLEGAFLIKPTIYKDGRGFIFESYSQRKFEKAGIKAQFVQDNHSFSCEKRILRGLHFQNLPHTQAKLVRVTKGAVFDVIVDLRKDSPTFGKWEGFELSADNFLMLYIPRGFAHGFQTLEENVEFQYKTDNFYAPEAEDGIIWNDPILDIKWPLEDPIILERDKNWQFFKDFESPF